MNAPKEPHLYNILNRVSPFLLYDKYIILFPKKPKRRYLGPFFVDIIISLFGTALTV